MTFLGVFQLVKLYCSQMILTYFFSDNCCNKLFRVANEELTNVDYWLTANKLSLNISKANYILCSRPTLNSKLPSNLPSLKLRNNILKRVSNLRFLGIVVHEHLSRKTAYGSITAKN